MVHYGILNQCGLDKVRSIGDGYSINLTWWQAYPDLYTNKIAYHIYYSCDERYVFYDGPKYVIIDGYCQSANIINLISGQDYWWSVIPVEYDPAVITYLTDLPLSHDNVYYYPSSLLTADIGPDTLSIPIRDTELFPPSAIVQIGIELIAYSSIIPSTCTTDGYLIVDSASSSADIKLSWTANPTNIGDGYIADGYFAVNGMPTQTFNVVCIFVEQDDDGYTIPGTEKFQCVGSISRNPIDGYTVNLDGYRIGIDGYSDGYGNFTVWTANGIVHVNELLGFAIVDGTIPFVVGDAFTITAINTSTSVTGGRGFNNTPITLHNTDGYDGYNYYSPCVSVTAIEEDNRWSNIYACQSRFEYPHYAYTEEAGFAQVTTDYLSTDLSAADAANVSFPEYDYAGYHRTDPVQLLSGTCVGSYIGGQMGCIDGNGNYNIYRGFSLQDRNLQNQEMLLSVTGRPALLLHREQTGIICSCYQPSSEYQDDRCPMCNGTKFVLGWEQYYDPRHSDGRLRIRVSPTAENLKMREAGLESELPFDMWSLAVPTIKTRDIIVLFDQANNEEFRYEVSDVVRNNTILGLEGMQKLKTFRIRKTDPAYQIRVFRDTSDFPSTLNTSLGFAPGLPPHSHTIVINENVLSVSQINQTTGIAQGHQHQVVNGQLLPALNHSHTIILPTK
jgi:hypothetical protein